MGSLQYLKKQITVVNCMFFHECTMFSLNYDVLIKNVILMVTMDTVIFSWA